MGWITDKQAERRAHPRVGVEVPVVINYGDAVLHSHSQDLSAGGICVAHSGDAPAIGECVEMSVDLGSSLAVPESAVIHSGNRAIAFVVEGTRIEPRAVELGPLVDGHYRVARGLHAGESVAVGAQFLIDSESRLRATSGPGASHGGH